MSDKSSVSTSQESLNRETEGSSQTSCEWDNFQQNSSYFESLENSLVDPDTRRNSSTDILFLDETVHHWPPRKPSSEPDNLEYLAHADGLQTVQEEEEVFHSPIEEDSLNEDIQGSEATSFTINDNNQGSCVPSPINIEDPEASSSIIEAMPDRTYKLFKQKVALCIEEYDYIYGYSRSRSFEKGSR